MGSGEDSRQAGSHQRLRSAAQRYCRRPFGPFAIWVAGSTTGVG